MDQQLYKLDQWYIEQMSHDQSLYTHFSSLAVHQQKPAPLSIYSRIYFLTKNRPEIGPETPFGAVAAGLGNVTAADEAGQIYPAFKHGNPNVSDKVLLVTTSLTQDLGRCHPENEILRRCRQCFGRDSFKPAD